MQPARGPALGSSMSSHGQVPSGADRLPRHRRTQCVASIEPLRLQPHASLPSRTHSGFFSPHWTPECGRLVAHTGEPALQAPLWVFLGRSVICPPWKSPGAQSPVRQSPLTVLGSLPEDGGNPSWPEERSGGRSATGFWRGPNRTARARGQHPQVDGLCLAVGGEQERHVFVLRTRKAKKVSRRKPSPRHGGCRNTSFLLAGRKDPSPRELSRVRLELSARMPFQRVVVGRGSRRSTPSRRG